MLRVSVIALLLILSAMAVSAQQSDSRDQQQSDSRDVPRDDPAFSGRLQQRTPGVDPRWQLDPYRDLDAYDVDTPPEERNLPDRGRARRSQIADDAEGDGADRADLRRPTPRTPLPAYRVFELLQREPDLLISIKRFVLRNWKPEGRERTEQVELMDDEFFTRIEQDVDLRTFVIRELRRRGYFAEELTNAPLSSKSMTAPRSRVSRNAPSTKPRPTEDSAVPELSRRPSPYPSLPSLRDLYTQFPGENTVLKRFGADVFRNGTGNTDDLPMDLPAGADYVLGPGDGLAINLWGSVSQRLRRTVDRQGQVALPEAGMLVVAGQTLAQAQQAIEKALSTQFRNVRVEVSLTRLRTVRVYIVGDVERPGAYDVSSLSTPLNVLYACGGPTSGGSLRTVRHYRGKQLVSKVDLYEVLLRGVRSDVERLQAGDTILVPPVGRQVTVAGMVKRPAIYELNDEKQLAEVLDLAGGVLVSATMREIHVERIEAHQRRTMLSLNVADGDDAKVIADKISDFSIQDGDRVTISPILPYSDQTVYLQGHVFRPGKYSYRKGIDVGQVIRSYQDLLPEPADHAEIVRLMPPDFRPTVIPFQLSEILSGDDPIELQPFDTIRIFGRYEIDPPKVVIAGEVLRPGEYPLAQGTTAAGLVRMAGGFKRSAFTHTADVGSYVVQNGEKVLTKSTAIDIAKALTGDTAADVTLKPGDVLTIRQLAGWKDIGAQVRLGGEVNYPGTYGIHEGERLSSLLRRAGGFRETAYPAGAVLNRVQVRELAEATRVELINRIESAGATTSFARNTSGQEQAALMQAMMQQQQHVIDRLKSQPATGRLVIRISSDISQWGNTAADAELRAGDEVIVPKRPNFVLISGQVYNSSAITYAPGHTAGWYLRQAGGPTEAANKKSIYVIRANGSVVGDSNKGGLWKGNVLSTRLQPGDAIVVPEKIVGGPGFWKGLLDTAQLTSSLAIAARVATSF